MSLNGNRPGRRRGAIVPRGAGEVSDDGRVQEEAGMEIYELLSMSRVLSTSYLASNWQHLSKLNIQSEVRPAS